MKDIKLSCSCWKIEGIAHSISPNNGNRIVCHCTDCQNFAKFLGNKESILDDYNGTDIFQMPLSKIEITQGKEYVKCMRITEKWLYRWYSSCCKTPIGNTMSAKMNFMWVIHNFMNIKNRDEILGWINAYSFLKEEFNDRKPTPVFKILPRMFYEIICWRFQKKDKISDFFNEKGEPISKPEVLNK